ncbi:MAG: hypothetical protein LBV41_11045 [Cytophagaceae bacterium]|jgi:hypothetical protein|nr:hypothetical protein [Cytophagaceae bacterium]
MLRKNCFICLFSAVAFVGVDAVQLYSGATVCGQNRISNIERQKFVI